MNKFTPGPWHTPGEVFFPMQHGHRAETYQAIGIGNGASHIALVSVLQSQAEEAQANARLIAACPDLVEALENLLAVFTPTGQDMRTDDYIASQFRAMSKAYEALNKAKGE